jgi:hypothetical protein
MKSGGMEYRISYGNGQVSETFGSYAAARTALMHQVEFDRKCGSSSASLRIQLYDGDGEWVGLGKAGRPHLEAS